MCALGLGTAHADKIRIKLLEPALFSKHAKRLYIASNTDKVINLADVVAHAEESKAMFGDDLVTMQIFEGSGHVAHARTEPERYWKAVEGLFA